MTVAIDCDLHRIYVVRDSSVLFNGSKDIHLICAAIAERPLDTVLFEIASAVDYTDSKAIAHNKRRWTIWNVACAMYLYRTIGDRLLVAPSSVWTKGHPVEVRHKLAGATLKNKDLRECQSMIWFYHAEPHRWVPLMTFLNGL